MTDLLVTNPLADNGLYTKDETMGEIDKRDLNPTPEARMAMALWNHEYAAQHGGCSRFFDDLTDGQKRTCKDQVENILEAAKKHRRIQ